MRELPAFVVVGQIRRPHGVRGAVLVQPTTDVAERFAVGARLWLVERAGRTEVVVERLQSHNSGLIVHFSGFVDREQVEGLRGARLEVSRDQVPAGEDGFFYFFELEGCSCFDQRAGELGTVAEVIEDGGGLLLRIVSSTRELLVPFVKEYLTAIDVEAGRIDCRLPEGLIEICTSTS